MAFDLPRIVEELERVPPWSPYPLELAVAILADAWRLAGRAPARDAFFAEVAARGPRWEEQLSMIAHLLAHTSLRDATVEALEGGGGTEDDLRALFDAIEPLTAEMIRAHPMRREELLRRWVQACGGRVKGEGAKRSRDRLEKLDYRKTLAEYDAAEKERARLAAKRQKELEEARARETAARGWRE